MKELSDQQRLILNLLTEGTSIDKIASGLRVDTGIIKAQITRMRNKGVTIPDAKENASKESTVRVEKVLSEQVLAAFEQARNIVANVAIDESTLPDLENRLRGQPGAEHYLAMGFHPFLQFDVVIKFVKLFGGRVAAHQAIEDVFGALRGFIGVKADEDVKYELPSKE